jgi:(2Fe-2S) ferredoxin
MNKPEHHLFVCGSFRCGGESKGECANKDSLEIAQFLQEEVMDRELAGVEVAMTGCLNMCVKGPIVIDYPSGHYYHGVTEEVAEAILDAIEEGEDAPAEYLVS